MCEAGSDATDVDQFTTLASRKQQTGDSAAHRFRRFVADDRECVALHAFDLLPFAMTAGTIRTIETLCDNSLEAEFASALEELVPIRINRFRVAYYAFTAVQYLFERLPPLGKGLVRKIATVEIEKIEGEEYGLTGKTPAATSAESLLQQAEVRSALFIQNDRLAVEDHCIVAELLRIVGNV